jgi:hypothetical protein
MHHRHDFVFSEISIRFVNAFHLALAFLLELMALAAYACVGVLVSGSTFLRCGAAAITVSTVIALWAFFAAPQSQHRLRSPRLYFFKMLIFGGAAAILLAAHWVHLAIAFVFLAISSLVLESLVPEANQPTP